MYIHRYYCTYIDTIYRIVRFRFRLSLSCVGRRQRQPSSPEKNGKGILSNSVTKYNVCTYANDKNENGETNRFCAISNRSVPVRGIPHTHTHALSLSLSHSLGKCTLSTHSPTGEGHTTHVKKIQPPNFCPVPVTPVGDTYPSDPFIHTELSQCSHSHTHTYIRAR